MVELVHGYHVPMTHPALVSALALLGPLLAQDEPQPRATTTEAVVATVHRLAPEDSVLTNGAASVRNALDNADTIADSMSEMAPAGCRLAATGVGVAAKGVGVATSGMGVAAEVVVPVTVPPPQRRAMIRPRGSHAR